ncbi:MAG: hypothetical protein GY801_16185 [bacterium]|nr:hypothetical protein [bacterium]
MKIEWFDIMVTCILVILILACLVMFSLSHYFVATILIILALWSALILGGRIAAPFYLEGNVVKLLQRHHGRMPLKQIKAHFQTWGETTETIFQRLEQRNNKYLSKIIL